MGLIRRKEPRSISEHHRYNETQLREDAITPSTATPTLVGCRRRLVVRIVVVVVMILFAYGNTTTTTATTAAAAMRDKDENRRLPVIPWRPEVLKVETINKDSFWEDIIWRYGPIETVRTTVHNNNNVDNKQSQNHSSTTGDDCQVPLVTSKVFFTNYTPEAVTALSKFVLMDEYPPPQSPSANANTNTTLSVIAPPQATCRFRNYQYSAHLPHFMQQFFRCLSFWNHYPNHSAVFSYQPKKSNHYRRAMVRPFTAGLMKLLPDLNIQLELGSGGTGDGNGPKKERAHNETNNASSGDVSCTIVGPLHSPQDVSFQVTSVQDMKDFRDKVLDRLSLQENSTTNAANACRKQEPRIVVLNRRHSRKLVRSQQLRDAIQYYHHHNNNNNKTVPEYFLEGADFQTQVELLSTKVDILVTPHGAQETSLVFLPDCAGVFEVIPGGYYYPNFFGTLAASSGVSHSFLYLGGGEGEGDGSHGVAYHYYNVSVRNPDLCPPLERVEEAVRGLVERWRHCCETRYGS